MTRRALTAARWGLGACVIALAACQPVDDEAGLGAPSTPSPTGSGLSAEDVDALTAATRAPVEEWDPEARLVELSFELDGGAPVSGRATYVGPDADRLLVLEVEDGRLDEHRPTAETLGFEPVPGSALEDVPAPPGDVVEPAAVSSVAQEALEECGVSDVTEVLYATGAPGAWDGQEWVTEPSWQVTVLDGDAGVVLEPDGQARSGSCLDLE